MELKWWLEIEISVNFKLIFGSAEPPKVRYFAEPNRTEPSAEPSAEYSAESPGSVDH